MIENNSILQKLDGLVSRFEEVSTLITDPSVIADQDRFVKLTREYKDLGDIMDARKRYISCLDSIKEAKDILANESDPEMKEMAREELAINEEQQPKIEEEIKIALVPKDPEDAKNVQMEIRAGTGGDEAALFAGDLFSMYKKFCDSKGWNLSITSVSEGAVGGFKEIDFAVSGDNVYGTLKYESGVHRVQRVPATETQGRMHTSAATVAVLPEADKFEVTINEGEIKWDTFRSSGAGGKMGKKGKQEGGHATRGKTQTTGKQRRFSSSVPRPATNQRIRNAHSRACVPLYMIKSTRNMSMTLPTAARPSCQQATEAQKSAPITSHRDVSPTTASASPPTTCKDSSVATYRT